MIVLLLCYIDPGTGSMLFTVLIAIIGSAIYLLQNVKIKVGVLFHKNKKDSFHKVPFCIYSDDKRYWTTFEPICDEFEKKEQKVLFLTSSKDDPALNKQYSFIRCEYIGEGNKAFARLNFLKANILLATTPGLDVYQWKRSKNVDWYVHIPHAATDITMYRMFGIDYYDAILLSGEYQKEQVRELETLRNLPSKELRIVGIPYMDAMKRRLKNSADKGLPTIKEERTVLLAPSWGKSAILSKYGSKMIDALIATGYHVIVRPHPQSFKSEKDMLDKLMDKYGDKVEWNRDADNCEVLNKSDIMISDFSGVIFDFALVFDKPIIYADTSYDKAPYDCCWSKEELWTFNTLPKLGFKLNEDEFSHLKDIIDTCIEDEKFKLAREEARKETWEETGNGSINTVTYLMEKYGEILTKRDLCVENATTLKAQSA